MNRAEEYLEKFRLKAPSDMLREKILASVEVHRNTSAVLPGWLLNAARVVLTSAAAITVTILFLYIINNDANETGPTSSKLKECKELLSEIGMPEDRAEMIIAYLKPCSSNQPECCNINIKDGDLL